MKKLIMVLLFTATVSAQTIYKVTPGTKDNRLILTIENESKETELRDVKVRLVDKLISLSFQKTETDIEKIEMLNSRDVEFIFEVKGVVDVKRVDTLKFMINNNMVSRTKEILIGYEIPSEFKLEQNYPNPFNPTTLIRYQLPDEGKITLKVYDILGREILTLIEEEQEAGYYEKRFDASGLSSGMYIYALFSENNKSIKKMMLIK